MVNQSDTDAALNLLRDKLGVPRPIPARPEGEGDVTFHRFDGRTVFIESVAVDSISPLGANSGVVAVEFLDSDRIVHVPFVTHWEINY